MSWGAPGRWNRARKTSLMLSFRGWLGTARWTKSRVPQRLKNSVYMGEQNCSAYLSSAFATITI
ncbi:MAG: hypothetical protein QOD96_7012, partial [Pseudonocardiales bacterium]|nr:hypothetical protein [Pseudonocardiales bacterium]